jgi:hypothetical protein
MHQGRPFLFYARLYLVSEHLSLAQNGVLVPKL